MMFLSGLFCLDSRALPVVFWAEQVQCLRLGYVLLSWFSVMGLSWGGWKSSGQEWEKMDPISYGMGYWGTYLPKKLHLDYFEVI